VLNKLEYIVYLRFKYYINKYFHKTLIVLKLSFFPCNKSQKNNTTSYLLLEGYPALIEARQWQLQMN